MKSNKVVNKISKGTTKATPVQQTQSVSVPTTKKGSRSAQKSQQFPSLGSVKFDVNKRKAR